ncbi:hypothetical protein Tco_0700809 [Tanacetum coccineum]
MDFENYEEGKSMQRPPLFEASALNESSSSLNHVRKFLRALSTKWQPKVTTIDESKDLSTLSLDKFIGNLKIYEVVLKKVSKASKVKKESNDEEYAMVVRDFKKFFRRRERFMRQPYDDEKAFLRVKEDKKGKAFVGGSLSDSDEEEGLKKDGICLMAHESNEASTSEVKQVKFVQKAVKKSSDMTDPFKRDLASSDEGIQASDSAGNKSKSSTSSRTDFVCVIKKTSPNTTV